MRSLSSITLLLSLPALALLPACGDDDDGTGIEDCGNGSDDDGDGNADCDDSECVTNDACTTESDCGDAEDNDGDGDVDCDDDDCADDAACDTSDTEDCTDGDDNDGDGDTDCEDSECISTDDCRWYEWVETGTATVVPGTSYNGTTQWIFTGYYTGAALCTLELDATSTAPAPNTDLPVECEGCDFAFVVDLTNGRQTAGDCAALDLDTTGAQVYSYGYGYDADYDYNGSPTPSLMYYSTYYSAWYSQYGYATASFDGTTFEYDWNIGYDYY